MVVFVVIVAACGGVIYVVVIVVALCCSCCFSVLISCRHLVSAFTLVYNIIEILEKGRKNRISHIQVWFLAL